MTFDLLLRGGQAAQLRYAGMATDRAALKAALTDPGLDLPALEKQKIQGAVRTDFILSAEIIVIALGTVAAAPFAQQVAVVVGIALLMTVGVYGIVAGIVKMDDAGLYLSQRGGAAVRALGRVLLTAAPTASAGIWI